MNTETLRVHGAFFCWCCSVGTGEFADGCVEIFDQGTDDGVDDPDVDPGTDEGSHCECDACGEEAVGS